MTACPRSPLSVVPLPAHNPAHRPRRDRVGVEVRDVLETFGPVGVEPVVREHVRRSALGRASCPAEVTTLREWLDVEVEECVAYWLDRLSRPGVKPEPDLIRSPSRRRSDRSRLV